MKMHDPDGPAGAAYVDPRLIFEAPPQEDARDEIARIIDPQSWLLRERALMPYRESRGSYDTEHWLYAVTWLKGFRTVEQVDEWLRKGGPLPEDHTHTFHIHFQESIRKADAVLAMLRERDVAA